MKISNIFFISILLLSIQLSAQFSLPTLNYKYDELQPSIDSTTMRIHYSKHHAAYVKNLNDVLQKHPEYSGMTLEELIANINHLPQEIRMAVRNNGGGHYNHSLFWSVLTPQKKSKIGGPIVKGIKKQFGSVEAFKEEFNKAAASQFGSGWAWLLVDKDGNLKISSTANQDNPLMIGVVDVNGTPILGLDVWEHAYYLNYQNRRADYIKNYWYIINWDEVNKRYQEAIRK